MMLRRQPKVIRPNGATVKQQPRLLGLLSGCVVRSLRPRWPARHYKLQPLLPAPGSYNSLQNLFRVGMSDSMSMYLPLTGRGWQEER